MLKVRLLLKYVMPQTKLLVKCKPHIWLSINAKINNVLLKKSEMGKLTYNCLGFHSWLTFGFSSYVKVVLYSWNKMDWLQWGSVFAYFFIVSVFLKEEWILFFNFLFEFQAGSVQGYSRLCAQESFLEDSAQDWTRQAWCYLEKKLRHAYIECYLHSMTGLVKFLLYVTSFNIL